MAYRMSYVHPDVVQLAEKIIDGKLADPIWLGAWRRGNVGKYYYNFHIPFELSDSQKQELRSLYVEAEWGYVDFPPVIEEPDSPPRPGTMVVLHQAKP